MQVKRMAFIVLPLLVASIACSSGLTSFDSSPSGGFAGGTGGIRPDSGFSGGPGPCPTDPYDTNARCTAPLRCEYGKSSSADCNAVANCTDLGVFDITPASSTTCDDRCPTFDAPGALATAQGMPCLHGSRGNLVCGSPYDRSTCGCADPNSVDGGNANDGSTVLDASADASAPGAASDGGDGGVMLPDVPGVWICVTPAGGCPATRPALGSPCVHDIVCDYGACVFPGGLKLACAPLDGNPNVSSWIDQTPIACGGKT